jgi:hypothetical protein
MDDLIARNTARGYMYWACIIAAKKIGAMGGAKFVKDVKDNVRDLDWNRKITDSRYEDMLDTVRNYGETLTFLEE